MQKDSYQITLLFLVVACLLVLMTLFIFLIIYLHRKKEISFLEKLKETEDNYEKNLLNSQLEIQEQTFQHISREIHDNISLSLTLAKLQIHTFEWDNKEKSEEKLNSSIDLLTNSIAQLSDISKSLNSDIISQHGLLEAIEEELNRIRKTGLFTIKFEITGSPVYMDSRKELIIFRIIQEAFNNILKHAGASAAGLSMHYGDEHLAVTICDNGKGYSSRNNGNKNQAGLRNMETRARILNGQINISSRTGTGTVVSFTIPFE